MALYVITLGQYGEEAMIGAAFLPWWLPLVAVPVLLFGLFAGLGPLDLDEFL